MQRAGITCSRLTHNTVRDTNMGTLQNWLRRLQGAEVLSVPPFRASEAPVWIGIVSQEPLANIIPILQQARTPGERALLVVTAQMQDKAGRLQRFLQEQGLEVDILPFDVSNLHSITASASAVRSWLDTRADRSRWLLNITGGTKLMSRELERALAPAHNCVIMYADTGAGRIDLPESGTSHRYENVLGVENYLKAQGFTPSAALNTKAWYAQAAEEIAPMVKVMHDIALGRYTGGDFDRAGDIIAACNSAAQQVLGHRPLNHRSAPDSIFASATLRKGAWFDNAAGQFPFPIQEGLQGARPSTQKGFRVGLGTADQAWLRDLRACGVVAEAPEGSKARFAFPDYRSAMLVGGFWLEWYVMQQVAQLGFQDAYVRHGQEVRWRDDKPRSITTNELDVVLVHQARMLLIECKTIRMRGQSEKAADALYKLEHLRRYIGSVRSEALLVSAAPVTRDETTRIENMGPGVHCCAGRNIASLHQFLRLWRDNRANEWRSFPGSPPRAPRKRNSGPSPSAGSSRKQTTRAAENRA